MTKEEKQLLLKDLSARLPYGVVVHFHDINVDDYDRQLIGEDLDYIELDRRNCKPYLRPLSTMTENEWKEYNQAIGSSFSFTDEVDWLNTHHFDYRGLIPMGLALEAKEGMYKTK